MSLTSLGQAAARKGAAQRQQVQGFSPLPAVPPPPAPRAVGILAAIAPLPPVPLPPPGVPPVTPASATTSGSSTASLGDQLLAYIPSEVLAIYVASMGVLTGTVAGTNSAADLNDAIWVFWICVCLAPLWVLASYILSGSTLDPKRFPYWSMTASVIAFVIWAIALGNPWLRQNLGVTDHVGALLVIFSSPVLAMTSRVVSRLTGT